MTLGAVLCTYGIKIDSVLETRHTCDEEFLAVRSPERDAEILVKGRIEVGPGDRFITSHRAADTFTFQVHDTDAHLRIGLSGLRISGLAERASKSKVCHARAL